MDASTAEALHKTVNGAVVRGLRDTADLRIFCDLSWSGLGHGVESEVVQQALVVARKYLKEPEPPTPSPAEAAKLKEHKKRVGEFAQRELKEGYPFLYNIATVMVWTAVEATVADVVVASIELNSDVQESQALRRLRAPVLEILNAPPDERAEFISALLIDDLRARLKQGVGRFDVLLDAVGLSGGVTPAARKWLFELSQIRNAIVHRGARADKRLCAACPWLRLRLGDRISLSQERFRHYGTAASWYLIEILRRVRTIAVAAGHADLDPNDLVSFLTNADAQLIAGLTDGTDLPEHAA